MNGVSLCRLSAVVVLLSIGCSGSPADPFRRASVTGSVTLDGQPVRWGGITLRGQKNATTQEQAFASYAIRDGQIVEDSEAPGASDGMNEITVTVYDSDPTDESKEPVIRGTWLGQLTVKSGEPLDIKIEANALMPPEPNT